MDAILGLIDDIYEAGAHPEHWQQALKSLAETTGSIDATMGGQTPALVPMLVTARTAPDFVSSYAEHYHTRNAMQLAVHALPVGKPVLDHMVLDQDAFRAGEFYNEWCRPQNYLHGAALNLATSGGWRATLMVSGRQEYGLEVLRIFRLISPHLVRAFQLNQVLHETQAMGMGAFAALEYLDRGALLVGANGVVRTANSLAETILARGDGLELRNGQLVCSTGDETARLNRMISQSVRGIVSPEAGLMRISRRGDHSPLSLQCLPFPNSH